MKYNNVQKSGSLIHILIAFLRKIALFGTCIHILWSVFIVGMSVFLDYNRLPFYVHSIVPVIGYIMLAAAGAVIWFKLNNNRRDKGILLTYQIFYYLIPIVVSVLKIIFFDNLYTFEGGMFPGLTALGSYVFYIVIAVTGMVGCIIFNIVRIVKKRRGERAVKPEEERNVEPDEAQNTKPDRPQNTKPDEALNGEGNDAGDIKLKITDFLNLAIVGAAIMALLYLIVSFVIYESRNQMNQHVISQNDDYRTYVLTELIESEEYEKAMWRGVNEDGTIERENGEQDVPLFDEAEYELCWEAYTYSLFVEVMAKDESIKASDCKNVGVSKISAEVLEQGKNAYISFTKRYVPEGGVAMEGQNIVYDADKKTVSVSSGLQCIDQSKNCTVDACMVVVFDKNWKVTDIYCQDRELEQVNQY